jgi:DNA-binding NarL/FixJ family response regulator
MSKSRLLDATSRAGVAFESTRVDGFLDAVAATHPSLVIVDLDEGRDEALKAVRAARAVERPPSRIVGFYSHVDKALGEAAEEAGCEPWPRGRFWRSLDQLLQPD